MLKFRGLFRTPDGLWVKIYFKVSPRTLCFWLITLYSTPHTTRYYWTYNSIC